MLAYLQIWIAIPAPALAAQPAPRANAPAATPPVEATSTRPPSAQRPVVVNRTPPRVTPPPLMPTFSAQPTDKELTEARIFGEPLVAIGRATLPEENRALAEVIRRYLETGNSELVLPFWGFLRQFPDSPWRASLLLNLGLVYRRTGYFSRALETWESGWSLTKTHTDVPAKAIANRTVGELFELHARLGRYDRLEALFAEIEGRAIGGPANEQITGAREGLWLMRNRPGEAFRCGPLAVDAILTTVRTNYQRDMRIWNSRSTTQGTSLVQMQQLASELDLPMQMVFRPSGAAPVLPALVHWRAGHFAALIREESGRLLVRDPTFGDEIWITQTALDDEGTGYMLIPQQPLPSGWRSVDEAEGATVWGKGATGMSDNKRNRLCDRQDGGCDGGYCTGSGMPVYSAHLMLVSLSLRDTPVGYTPPRGPDTHFTLRYSQREAYQPQTFVFSHLGPKWMFDWLSYIEDDPTNPNAIAHLAVRGGGRETFQGFNSTTQEYQREPLTGAVLVRTSSSPIRYERRLKDGSVEVFAQPDGAMTYPRRVFMTEWRDAAGNAVIFTYDAQLRLVAAIDALGQVTTLTYDDPLDTRRLTRVTDPFGRFASFTYDTLGRLSTVTDVIGLTSSFTYDSADFITAMTTPYGTSRFSKGENGADRWLEMVDPVGGRERVEYRRATVMPTSEPAALVPSGPGLAFTNLNLEYRNTFYWTKRAMAVAPRDLASAHIIHGLHAAGPLSQTSGTVESEKFPLESRVWYRYPEQVHSFAEGSQHQPSVRARVLDDGTSQVWQTTFSAQGLVASVTDPAGRRTSLTYHANGIDLSEVRQTTGTLNDKLAGYSNYTTAHRAQTIVDAANKTWTRSFNTHGQNTSVVNPNGETATYSYTTDGYLENVTGDLPGAPFQYTYDAYGRVRTSTDSDGYTLAYDYDALDRPTRVTFPDSTFDEVVYDKLDVAEFRDRLGRRTRLFHDAVGRLIAIRDASGVTTTRRWCACGSLDAIVDGNGRGTSWEYDLQGRMVRERRHDGSFAATLTYAGRTPRLVTVTDAAGQVKTYAYNIDDTLQSVAYSNATVATPTVSYAYDPNYRRMVSMVDGTGQTAYTYHPIGVTGAGLVASVDGPLTNDVITFAYDDLGRIVTRAINSVSATFVYDTRGRLESDTNVLGTFEYGYDGTTGRIASLDYPNGLTSTFSYYGNTVDRRLQTIHQRRPDTSTLSRFDYAYDAVGNVVSWQQQYGTDTPTISTLGYDDVDQLRRAEKRLVGTPSTLLKRYAYTYDAVGNRRAEQIDDVVVESQYDVLNRLTQTRPGGALRFAGTVSEPATVTIQGIPATVSAAGAFEGSMPLSQGTSTIAITATDASGNAQTNTYEVDALGSTRTITHDANGNVTSDGVRTFEWDAANRMVSLTRGAERTEYTYNGVGERVRVVRKVSGATTSDRYYLWTSVLAEERDATSGTVTKRFFTLGAQENDIAYFYGRDHLGNVTELLDSTSTVRARYAYDPFGRRTKLAGDLEADAGFTGHLTEDQGTLALTRFRMYDPDLARWLSEDPIGNPEFSLYAYVNNSPTTDVDPLGLQDTPPPPPNIPGGPWWWERDYVNKRGGTWRDEHGNIATWERKDNHWDVATKGENGQAGGGSKQRYDNRGNPLTADQAHDPPHRGSKPIDYTRRGQKPGEVRRPGSPRPRGGIKLRIFGGLCLLGMLLDAIEFAEEVEYCKANPCECDWTQCKTEAN